MKSSKIFLYKWILVGCLALLVGCDGTTNILGTWKGKVVTEAINVGLEVNIVALAQGDSGNWKFIGDNGQILNQGDIQAWPPAGNDVVIILIQGELNQQSGNAATLYGTLSVDGNKMEGEYALLGPGGHGGFDLTRQ